MFRMVAAAHKSATELFWFDLFGRTLVTGSCEENQGLGTNCRYKSGQSMYIVGASFGLILGGVESLRCDARED